MQNTRMFLAALARHLFSKACLRHGNRSTALQRWPCQSLYGMPAAEGMYLSPSPRVMVVDRTSCDAMLPKSLQPNVQDVVEKG